MWENSLHRPTNDISRDRSVTIDTNAKDLVVLPYSENFGLDHVACCNALQTILIAPDSEIKTGLKTGSIDTIDCVLCICNFFRSICKTSYQ